MKFKDLKINEWFTWNNNLWIKKSESIADLVDAYDFDPDQKVELIAPEEY